MAWFNAGDILTAKLLNAAMGALVAYVTPPGVIQAYGGAAAPSGWLLCDGSAVSRSTYADLFAAIGTAFGAGDGSTTFNIPNLKGRVPVGENGATFTPVGHTGGEETHSITSGEMPSHSHTGTTDSETTDHTHQVPVSAGAGGTAKPGPGSGSGTAIENTSGRSTVHAHTFTTASAGSGTAHNNIQPYVTTTYIIKT